MTAAATQGWLTIVEPLIIDTLIIDAAASPRQVAHEAPGNQAHDRLAQALLVPTGAGARGRIPPDPPTSRPHHRR